MGKAREYTWYLYSEQAHTNGAIVRELDPDKDLALQKMCADGVSRNLWKTDHALISQLKKSVRAGEHYEFLVFRQEGNSHPALFEGFPKEKYQREARMRAHRNKALRRRVHADSS